MYQVQISHIHTYIVYACMQHRLYHSLSGIVQRIYTANFCNYFSRSFETNRPFELFNRRTVLSEKKRTGEHLWLLAG